MKVRLPNTTTSQDEDEIGAYCVTAVRDFTSLLTMQMGGMIGTWVRGKTPHDNGPTAGLAAALPTMRTVHEYLPISKGWPAEKLATYNVTADGRNSRCIVGRWPRAGRDDDSRNYQLVESPVNHLHECEGHCTEHLSSCNAIQYKAAARRCELWYRWPQTAGWSRGTTCLKRVTSQQSV